MVKKKIYIIAIFFVLHIGCDNPFSTRTPEEPVSNQSSWIQPTSPNYVLANLRNAIAEKNITNYMRCLADTSNSILNFRFEAEPAVANANPGLFNFWNKDQEFNFLNQLFAFLPDDSTSAVSFQQVKENTFQDSVFLLQDYSLVIKYKCEQDCIHEMKGQVEFRLMRNNEDLWSIYKWNDYSTGDDLSWSALKARFGK